MHKLLLLVLAIGVFGTSGCANKEFAETVDLLRDDTFTVGCVTGEVRLKVGLGIYGQGGDAEGGMCKLKCTETLPPQYCFKYKNPITGCEAQAGPGCNDGEPQEVIVVQPKGFK